jgi:transaldolase
VTVTFSPLQALLAAKVGATYISPFVGRLDAVGHDGMDLVRQIKTIYQNYGFKTQIIAAAARTFRSSVAVRRNFVHPKRRPRTPANHSALT